MVRFLALAIPVVLLVLALAATVQDATGWGGDETDLSRLGLLAREDVGPVRLGEWLLEALGLTALFLLVQGRGGAWWLDGLVAGSIAWIFRGPALVLTLSRVTRLPPEPWIGLTEAWLVTYLVAGLSLALVARQLGVRR